MTMPNMNERSHLWLTERAHDEASVLMQKDKIQHFPIILMGQSYWNQSASPGSPPGGQGTPALRFQQSLGNF